MVMEVRETDQMPQYLLATMPLLSDPHRLLRFRVLAFSLKAVGSGVPLLTVFNRPLLRRQLSSEAVHWAVSCTVTGLGVQDDENPVPAPGLLCTGRDGPAQSDAFGVLSRHSRGGSGGGGEQGMGTLPAQGHLRMRGQPQRPLRLRRSSQHGGQRSQCAEARADEAVKAVRPRPRRRAPAGGRATAGPEALAALLLLFQAAVTRSLGSSEEQGPGAALLAPSLERRCPQGQLRLDTAGAAVLLPPGPGRPGRPRSPPLPLPGTRPRPCTPSPLPGCLSLLTSPCQ